MNNTNTPKKPWTTGEKFLLGGIVTVVALAALLDAFLHVRDADPVVSIPTPRMPAPNAFDFYVAAGNAVVVDKKIGLAVSRRPAPGGHVYTLAEKDALVAANTGPLKTLRQGFAYPYLNPPARSFSALFPYFAKERGLARLLSLEGQTRAAHGDWNGAANSYLDAVQMGEEIPHGSVLIGMLVGIACQAIGRRPLWETVGHLDAKAAKASARRLERIQTRHLPYVSTLQEEKWLGQAGLMEIFGRPGWRGELQSLWGMSGSEDGSTPGVTPAMRLQMQFVTKRQIMDGYTGYMENIIANARQSYAKHPADPPTPTDPFNRVLLPVFTQARLKEVDSVTQNALLTATLALRAYKLEHGAYPASLTALTPGYLKVVPPDPFALSGPLRYKRQGAAYSLYSVGPDGKDDGGRAIFDASSSGATRDQRRRVNADSIGDIVAGVNLF